MRTWPGLLLLILFAAACSSDSGPDSPTPAGSAGTACETVEVPAHEGVDVPSQRRFSPQGVRKKSLSPRKVRNNRLPKTSLN